MDDNNEGAEVARRLARQWLNEGNEGTELIPLSHLALDHPEPVDGWGRDNEVERPLLD